MALYLCTLTNFDNIELGYSYQMLVCSSSEYAARRLCETRANSNKEFHKKWTDKKQSNCINITKHNTCGILAENYL